MSKKSNMFSMRKSSWGVGGKLFFVSKCFEVLSGINLAHIGIKMGIKWSQIEINLCLWYNCFESNLMRSLLESLEFSLDHRTLKAKESCYFLFLENMAAQCYIVSIPGLIRLLDKTRMKLFSPILPHFDPNLKPLSHLYKQILSMCAKYTFT